ncbi:MAG TPA: CheR family methyltransferase [Candidatus Baltobacteraceae bacterium]
MASALKPKAGAPPVEPTLDERELEEIELQLLMEAMRWASGGDYRESNQPVLRRRIAERMRAEGSATISALQDRVLHDRSAFVRFVIAMSEGPRELFLAPEFFAAVLANVVPLLKTYSFVRIWFPAVGLGEDAYALACLLADVGLLDRCVIYATSTSNAGVDVAKEGAYPIVSEQAFRAALRRAGIAGDAARFADIQADVVVFKPYLREALMFARHNAASDASINEFHAIVARNVLPLYNATAQYRMHRLIFASLARLGFLCLGPGETLAGSVHEGAFRQVVSDQPIYRRMR